MKITTPSPIELLEFRTEPSGIAGGLMQSKGLEIYIKRDDLIHPEFGGNKWRKLKYNIEAYHKQKYTHLITYGGPFSNHIAATASACKYYSIPCTGIIRGSHMDETNPTLVKAKANGMIIKHVAKCDYKIKEAASEIREIIAAHDHPLVIPEGGNNQLAIKGAMEIIEEVRAQGLVVDYIIISGGTGTTASGIISASHDEEVIVMNALKNPALTAAIKNNLQTLKANWHVNEDYHFGRFAKVTSELVEFINAFFKDFSLALDPIYNGKTMYGLFDLFQKNYFPVGAKILYVYTGGLQGVTAYNYRCKKEARRLEF